MSAGPSWQEVLRGVHLFRDSCNVYAIEAPEGCLVVDAGTGLWLEHVAELPAAAVALACTHFFRDHSAGAVVAARSGVAVWVPEGEVDVFREPGLHFSMRESYVVYDNYWDHFAPIEAVPVTGVLRDHEVLRLAGSSSRSCLCRALRSPRWASSSCCPRTGPGSFSAGRRSTRPAASRGWRRSSTGTTTCPARGTSFERPGSSGGASRTPSSPASARRSSWTRVEP
jgi:hypothetical protein